jgi:glycolate oxidase FAD binding subunit
MTATAVAQDYELFGSTPTEVARPTAPEDVAIALLAADQAGRTVVPWGAGTKQSWGNPPSRYDVALDLTALDQIVEYEPADLVVTAQAGMALAALQSRLREAGQFLPLDPPFIDRATLGGTIAANASGPSRLLYGTARDFVLGLRVATPQGQLVRSGGRVVKNVVGYDLNKLHVGGFGTAGVIVEVTFKVQPLPAAESTVVAHFAELGSAAAVANRVARSSLFPRAVGLGRHFGAAQWNVIVWCGGAPATVERQARDVTSWATEGGATDVMRRDGDEHAKFWQRASDFARHDAGPGLACLKLTCLPSQVPAILARVPTERAGVLAHAGNGVAYVGISAPTLHDVRPLAAAAHELGGNAVLENAPDALKREIDSWDPAGVAARIRTDFDLMRRIKQEFDPHNTLNPGRFVAGI